MSLSTWSNDVYATDAASVTPNRLGYEGTDNPPAFPQATYTPGVQGNMSSSYSTAPAAPYGYQVMPTGLSNEPHQINYPPDRPCGLAQDIPRGRYDPPSGAATTDSHPCGCCVIA